MSKIGAVHCNPKIMPHLQHNDRTNSTSPNINKDLSHLNECNKSAKEALQEIDKLYKEAQEKLNQAKKKGKRTPKERSYHEFIYEIKENTTMAQCEALTQKIAELTGFTPIQVTIHRDEGHTNEKGEFVTHYHAHAVFFTLDKNTGKQLARRGGALNPKNLSTIQDLASDCLNMQRGQKYFDINEYENAIKEKRPYKPQAPKKIQNQDDYKRFITQSKAQKVELNKKVDKEIAELRKEMNKYYRENKEIEKRANFLKEKDADLKEREKIVSKEKKEVAQEKEKLYNTESEAFKNLELEFRRKKSFFKNLITFGKYNKKIIESYNHAKKALEATLRIKNIEIERKEKKIKEQQQENERTRIELNARIQDYKIKNLELETKVSEKDETISKMKDNINSIRKDFEKRVFEAIDYKAEVEYYFNNNEQFSKRAEPFADFIAERYNKEQEQQKKQEQTKTYTQGRG